MQLLFHAQSAIVLRILYAAFYYRRERMRHVPLALTGLICDLVLILQIELSRAAGEKALQVVTNTALLNYHVAVAITVVALYAILIGLGLAILAGRRELIRVHKPVGILALVLRTSTFVTAFLI